MAQFSIKQTLDIEEQMNALYAVLNVTVATAFVTYNTTIQEIESTEAVQAVLQDIEDGHQNKTHDEFSFMLNQMLQNLYQDAHFRVEVTEEATLGENYQYLDLCLAWLEQGSTVPAGLVNTCQTDYADIGDLIVDINGITPELMFERLRATIPHENTFFLQGLPVSWLVRTDFLAMFGVVPWGSAPQNIPVTLRRSGQLLTYANVPLVAHSNRTSSSINNEDGEVNNDDFVSYQLLENSSTAVFTLNECTYDETFTSVLTEFWNKVLTNEDENEDGDILAFQTVVLDLRKNIGGEAAVIPAFLRYLDIPPYSLFRVEQRTSPLLCDLMPILCDRAFLSQFGIITDNNGSQVMNDELYQVSSQVIGLLLGAQVVDEVQTNKKFPVTTSTSSGQKNNFFVLTSGTTFSSAHLFAMVVQDNGIGRVVGTPTGNSLPFYGNLVRFTVPHTNLTLMLTTSLTAKDESHAGGGPNDITVIPDQLVGTTFEDVQFSRDPQLQWVLDQVQRNDIDTGTAAPSPSSSSPLPTLPTSTASTLASPSMATLTGAARHVVFCTLALTIMAWSF
eukprot:scaffold45329_cov57-Attheya_sp.AAC.4